MKEMALHTLVNVWLNDFENGLGGTVPAGTLVSELTPAQAAQLGEEVVGESDAFKAKGGADLADLKVSELRKLAEARGFTGLSKKNHEQLVALLSSEVTDAADL